MNWTGNLYVDIGLATILAFCDKDDPTHLNASDFNKVADWIAQNYVKDPLKSFLTVAFTSNAWFAQPSFTPEKRKERGQLHLYGWQRPNETGDRCVFTGLPAASSALSDKLAIGRAARAQIPLTQGDEDINFYPSGYSGLPISGEALLCLQAFPLGCAKVQGRLLAVHASEPQLTLAFAARFLRDNLVGIDLAHAAGSTKLRESPFALGTTLVSALIDLARQQAQTLGVSVTAYHLTNGQSPEIAIYHLPLGVMNFLRRALSAQQKPAWDRLVASAWQIDEAKPAKKKNAAAADTSAKADKPKRNFLFEDVLRLPDDAARFLRIYFLRKGLRLARADDPRAAYTPQKDIEVISWGLTDLFLTEVMNMDKTRIEQIRQLGDRLAHYVEAENDRKFFQAFYGETDYDKLRMRLVKANKEWVKRKNPPLITFDQYIEVFEAGEEIARKDWSLARDLVLIRMTEQLHGNGWLARNQDALPDETQPAAA